MRNMDELLLFLQKSSERHNSIAYAFEGKKADKQTWITLSLVLARLMDRLVEKRRIRKVTRNFIYPQPVRRMQRGPASGFSCVSTATIKLSTRHDPRSKLFSAHLQMRFWRMYKSGRHMFSPPQRFLLPSPLNHEVFWMLFVQRESDPDTSNTTVWIDSISATFVQVGWTSSASILLGGYSHGLVDSIFLLSRRTGRLIEKGRSRMTVGFYTRHHTLSEAVDKLLEIYVMHYLSN